MRYMRTENLKEGMIVVNDIFDPNKNPLHSLPLIKNNAVLTYEQIEGLKKYNINGIYVNDSISKNIEIVENIPQTLQKKAIDALRNFKYENIVECAQQIVAEYIYLSDISFDKLNISSNMYEHSINVCEFSVAVGKKMGYNRYDLTNLAIAALLHDIGKTCIDNNLLSKINISSTISSKINVDEKDEQYHYYMHPAYGQNMLSNMDNVSSVVRASVLQHHENENGSGFPLGLKSSEISEFAKIIHVCDVYDEIVTKNSPSEAFEYIMGGNGTLFNEEVVNIFKEFIPIYPKGITVVLSNGFRAIVLENHKGFPLRPRLILEDTGQIYDLMMPILHNITIESVDIFQEEKEKNGPMM